MMIMIIVALLVVGLCFGSFVNALVWRVHEQDKETVKPKPDKRYLKQLSISQGRSMCPHCKHELKAWDLLPVISWLGLKGKCRYCRKPISSQYPLVELTTALLFAASYIWWPQPLKGSQDLIFGLWLVLLTGFMALIVYDLRWLLLPDRIVYPLGGLAGVFALLEVIDAPNTWVALANTGLAVLVGGGIFYLIFQVSGGKWIGGGDVKLGWLLGLVVGKPVLALMFIFIAALLGTVVSLPLMAAKKVKASSVIPFGPFLVVGAIITRLFGDSLLHWYLRTFLNF